MNRGEKEGSPRRARGEKLFPSRAARACFLFASVHLKYANKITPVLQPTARVVMMVVAVVDARFDVEPSTAFALEVYKPTQNGRIYRYALSK